MGVNHLLDRDHPVALASTGITPGVVHRMSEAQKVVLRQDESPNAPRGSRWYW